MNEKCTERIKVWGVVQGVGFRPITAKLAREMDIKGCVRNVGGIAEIIVTGADHEITEFLTLLTAKLPPPGEILHFTREKQQKVAEFATFTISESTEGDEDASTLPVDIAICEDCLNELRDPNDFRWKHPFISCMSCGPRFTIMKRIPYDRENTSMDDFFLCGDCAGEYLDVDCRRFHAQTVSCHSCGPVLLWRGRAGINVGGERGNPNGETVKSGVSTASRTPADGSRDVAEAVSLGLENTVNNISAAASVIRQGGVIAFKAAGGYCFACSPFIETAVTKLRAIKIRDAKPFAIMFSHIEEISTYCEISGLEKELLLSRARPIVLLERREQFRDKIEICSEVYQNSRFIGAFLPSMGAQFLLLDITGPLIMTSANLSGMPIIKDDEIALKFLEAQPLLDGVLYNNRRILNRVDDSVLNIVDGKPQMIRRSKGFAPAPISLAAREVDLSGVLSGNPDGNALHKPERVDNPAGRIGDEESDNQSRAGEAGFSDICKGNVNDDNKLHGTKRGSSVPEVLAVGGQLKSTFTLTSGRLAYVSQHFGDLDTVESENAFLEGLESMKELLRVSPKRIVCDLHPNYSTTGIAENISETTGAPLLRIQHHHAHIASVMAEHNLEGPVIGVAFDGTGYGNDGNIWGGEFLLCEGSDCRRLAHLGYVPIIGGDSSINEAWKTALCYSHRYKNKTHEPPAQGVYAASSPGANSPPKQLEFDLSEIIEYSKKTKTADNDKATLIRFINRHDEGDEAVLINPAGCTGDYINKHVLTREMFAPGHSEHKLQNMEYDEEYLLSALNNRVNIIETSSVGRLFDAVASLLNIHHVNRYEGECAIMLESAAECGLRLPGEHEAWDLALKFHRSLARLVLETCSGICTDTGVAQVALSGGVFQNRLLIKECRELLGEEGFVVYSNVSVPANDGGISLGQAYLGLAQ